MDTVTTLEDPSDLLHEGSLVSWDECLRLLRLWKFRPGLVSDGERRGPTVDAIRVARSFVEFSRERKLAQPLGISPSGDGGIFLERRLAGVTEIVAIDGDGSSEYMQFRDCKLVRRITSTSNAAQRTSPV
jgi:hypothetical protein